MSYPLIPEEVALFGRLRADLARHGCDVVLNLLDLTPKPPYIEAPCFVMKMGGMEVRRAYSVLGVGLFAEQLNCHGWRASLGIVRHIPMMSRKGRP